MQNSQSIIATYPSNSLKIEQLIAQSLIDKEPFGIYATATRRNNNGEKITVFDREVSMLGGQYLPIEIKNHIQKHQGNVVGVVMTDTSTSLDDDFMPDEILLSLSTVDLINLKVAVCHWLALFNIETTPRFQAWRNKIENTHFGKTFGDMNFNLNTNFTIIHPDTNLVGGQSALSTHDKSKLYFDGGYHELLPYEYDSFVALAINRSKATPNKIDFFLDFKIHSDGIAGDIVIRLPFEIEQVIR